MIGMPLFDVYVLLIKLSRDGVIAVPGGDSAIESMSLSIEESMQQAFAALDANDDEQQRQSALEAVLGGDGDRSGEGNSAASALDAVLGDDVFGGSKAESAGGSDLDQAFLSILQRSKE